MVGFCFLVGWFVCLVGFSGYVKLSWRSGVVWFGWYGSVRLVVCDLWLFIWLAGWFQVVSWTYSMLGVDFYFLLFSTLNRRMNCTDCIQMKS